jgi:hypothetical protein
MHSGPEGHNAQPQAAEAEVIHIGPYIDWFWVIAGMPFVIIFLFGFSAAVVLAAFESRGWDVLLAPVFVVVALSFASLFTWRWLGAVFGDGLKYPILKITPEGIIYSEAGAGMVFPWCIMENSYIKREISPDQNTPSDYRLLYFCFRFDNLRRERNEYVEKMEALTASASPAGVKSYRCEIIELRSPAGGAGAATAEGGAEFKPAKSVTISLPIYNFAMPQEKLAGLLKERVRLAKERRKLISL